LHGEIDLDPCSNSRKKPNVPASSHFTAEDNGLKKDWHGRVFINPPFSETKPFLQKLIQEMELGHIPEAISLLKQMSGHRGFKPSGRMRRLSAL
jgi:hypothetical protein